MTKHEKINRDDLAYWLALSRAPGIGPKKFAKILQTIPELSDLFKPAAHKRFDLALSEITLNYLAKPDWDTIEQELRWSEQANNHIISWQHPAYPTLLQETATAPPILFIRGQANLLSEQQLAIVGSRNPTHSGKETAYQFAQTLAQAGLCITSGLALGVDAASHQGALSVQGATIAVLGTGMDSIYPRRHQDLAEKIAVCGALVSEFPFATTAKPENFPRRNRIISGLSMGTLVVEAALRSGSLITARYATEQGREVFALPGSIHNPLSKGCHELIRQGAKLVETVEHIIEELGSITKAVHQHKAGSKQKLLDIEQQKLVQCIGYEATAIDTIVERSGFSADKIASILPLIEITGQIISVPGGYMRA